MTVFASEKSLKLLRSRLAGRRVSLKMDCCNDHSALAGFDTATAVVEQWLRDEYRKTTIDEA